jgi:hypothetical protein
MSLHSKIVDLLKSQGIQEEKADELAEKIVTLVSNHGKKDDSSGGGGGSGGSTKSGITFGTGYPLFTKRTDL